jgi:hypothetical protein
MLLSHKCLEFRHICEGRNKHFGVRFSCTSCEVVDSAYLAQNRDQWQTLVHKILNLLITLKPRNILSIWATISSSMLLLLHVVLIQETIWLMFAALACHKRAWILGVSGSFTYVSENSKHQTMPHCHHSRPKLILCTLGNVATAVRLALDHFWYLCFILIVIQRILLKTRRLTACWQLIWNCFTAWRWLSSGMLRRVVWHKSIYISEVLDVSVIRATTRRNIKEDSHLQIHRRENWNLTFIRFVQYL